MWALFWQRATTLAAIFFAFLAIWAQTWHERLPCAGSALLVGVIALSISGSRDLARQEREKAAPQDLILGGPSKGD